MTIELKDTYDIDDVRSGITTSLDALESIRQRVRLIRLAVTSDLLGDYGSDPIAQGLDDLHVDIEHHLVDLRGVQIMVRRFAQEP
ncbi:hypothetical protein DLJ53_23875 [Acuticoccus sediminis]|uniref:Uncharacterized protein n=1 Tax=Acuticoccus sediminis TaxID=2184697 RepID=A0A8B2NMZ6_9HYPH|nr:hypothetical protein [Acuticoccus sediminis]RAH99548.1 hypothetical protein DLJ53_23875 [Acuticoccus sediminis]